RNTPSLHPRILRQRAAGAGDEHILQRHLLRRDALDDGVVAGEGLEQARQQESQNPAEALNLARQIPPGTTAHAAAQELIRKLAPPAPQPSPSPTP
ncbi:MAG: hypothetical protein NZ482_09855, partial [Gloeomargarita sp. SKYG98]|nr:hypothetical protein [Gloeomargarita sp. SKYG98]